MVGEYEHFARMSRARRLGVSVGNILLWATEQQARVDDLVIENAENNQYWPNGDLDELKKWLKDERDRQKEKLVWRKFEADMLTSLDMTLKIKGYRESTVGYGKLVDIDLPTSEIVLSNWPDITPQTINFAERKTAPALEDHRHQPILQSYYGHKLLVDFEVIHIPLGNEKPLQ